MPNHLNSETVIANQGVRVDISLRQAFIGDRELSLSEWEFKILESFLREPGRVFGRLELLQIAGLQENNNRHQIVSRFIKSLRTKLGVRGLIETVSGVGYRLRSSPRRMDESIVDSSAADSNYRPALPSVPSQPSPSKLRASSPHSQTLARRLPDKVWILFEPFLPPVACPEVGRKPPSNHCCFHALLYVIAAHIDWDYLPSCFPPARTIQLRLADWLERTEFHRAWNRLAQSDPRFQGVCWEKLLPARRSSEISESSTRKTSEQSQLDSVSSLKTSWQGAESYRSCRELKLNGNHRQVSMAGAVSASRSSTDERPKHAGIQIDRTTHRAFEGDRELDLSLSEFRLLDCLLTRAGEVVTYAELSEQVVPGQEPHSRGVETRVRWVRAKLIHPELIENVRGVGYRLAKPWSKSVLR